ncbi:MAG: septum formation protein Maf [Hellea sp.]|jgi:septum formation protein|nr:septum formation protein Maf [Hellea sp.]MBT4996741.1 septum formation protein Maf [Hellea sp.]MBT5836867.1 septum formation protein Maf [Hellea sp.]MBT7399484.1 septum formation protein Maf [Hellea sp.]
MNIILASGSPIRKQILEDSGVTFEVIVKPIDEASIKNSMVHEGASNLSIVSALAELKSIKVSSETPGLVIGADQIMVFEGAIYDKPKTIEEARERLIAVRNKTHYLMGSVVVSERGVSVWRYNSKVELRVRGFTDKFIDNYIDQEGDSLLQTVGAYRFEKRGSQLFSSVKGDFFSVLGLPLLPLLDYLRTRNAILS